MHPFYLYLFRFTQLPIPLLAVIIISITTQETGLLSTANVSMTDGQVRQRMAEWKRMKTETIQAETESHTRRRLRQQLIAQWWAAIDELQRRSYGYQRSRARPTPNVNELPSCAGLLTYRRRRLFITTTTDTNDRPRIVEKLSFFCSGAVNRWLCNIFGGALTKKTACKCR